MLSCDDFVELDSRIENNFSHNSFLILYKAMTRSTHYLLILSLQLISFQIPKAQMITGIWQGRIGTGLQSQKLELKLISKGDSLTGTSYYYSSNGAYSRYTVKGFFHPENNTVVWWDNELIEQKTNGVRLLSAQSIPLLSEADFNCPGGGKMMLDGNSVSIGQKEQKGPVHLIKTERPEFEDEWDFIISNFTNGSNDPLLIAETEQFWKRKQTDEKPTVTNEETVKKQPKPSSETPPVITKKNTVQNSKKTIPKDSLRQQPVQEPMLRSEPITNINQKFEIRKKQLSLEIPVTGDSIELHFYDNAEIDGDSISLFLNNALLHEHIRLTEKPYTIKMAVKDLKDQNELVMVAENLGSIPPNTSYMIVYINGQRLQANLESTENTSAMIRLIKPH